MTICSSQLVNMQELKDVFIELTAKNCNKRCGQCYIDFPLNKNVNDFMKSDKIKNMLLPLVNTNINCIYLIGAEPMSHPDFNSILRLCLKYSNVCICTNATYINEKKARFLKNVENESENQILFKLSFVHFDEQKNDNIRFRGSYRQNIYALKCLDKYEFTNIVCVSNYYKEKHSVIEEMFKNILFDNCIENAILQINEWHINSDENIGEIVGMTDCMTSRTITDNGVFTCPFLANDYRGRVGCDLSNYSKSVRLETSFCNTCIKNKDKIFSVDF